MNLVLPEMGEGIIEATIGQWLIELGDEVERLEPVVEVETDKVTTEVVADAAGKLVKIFAKEGETVAVGTVLAEFTPRSEAAGPLPTPAEKVEGRERRVERELVGAQESIANRQSKIENQKDTNGHGVSRVAHKVSPVVARMATEHELDLSLIEGTGKYGRITKRDVVAFLADGESREEREEVNSERLTVNSIQSLQPESFANQKMGNEQRTLDNGQLSGSNAPIVNRNSSIVNLSPMRRAIAEHMVESVRVSPHATTVHEVDFSAVMAHRRAMKEPFAEKGVNLTITAYIMKAVAQALSENMMVNSSWSDEGIAIHRDINIGMATAVQGGAGLVVPVIKHAADFNLLGMARVVTELTQKARDNKLVPSDMQGGTFTVTNHGVSGSLFATPIINQPQAGILGVGAIKKQVVVIEDEFGNDVTAIRPMGYLSCSFDHRILDGVSADGFVAAVVNHLQNWE